MHGVDESPRRGDLSLWLGLAARRQPSFRATVLQLSRSSFKGIARALSGSASTSRQWVGWPAGGDDEAGRERLSAHRCGRSATRARENVYRRRSYIGGEVRPARLLWCPVTSRPPPRCLILLSRTRRWKPGRTCMAGSSGRVVEAFLLEDALDCGTLFDRAVMRSKGGSVPPAVFESAAPARQHEQKQVGARESLPE
jgi:hypothetical protein